MPMPRRLQVNGRQRIALLSVAKWMAFPVMPALGAIAIHRAGPLALWCLVCVGLFFALRAWEDSRRRQFIREARLPVFLGAKLRQRYPQLSHGDADLVLRGLRQFFMAHLRSKHHFVAMPSQVADQAWHEFILHTKAYETWCQAAFGKMLHHTPAEVLGRDPKRNDGLRRAWYWACKEESIDPRAPSRLPLLFALDKKFAIPGGFSYVPDCRDIDRASGSGDYCGTSFGSDGSGDGGASGDAATFGGSDYTSSGGGDSDGGSSGDSSGCGGGCGGGD
ncbi:MAG: hypothetical protein CFE44_17470 [Burkholderiales bacterium PBB4]|nr:MAG: hypothetical protein CFE44_17470 [Burkholderiales bacterium PBB4]